MLRHPARPSGVAAFRAALVASLAAGPGAAAQGITTLDFTDVPPGTLVLASPYLGRGFTLGTSSGGFVVESAGTGNGAPQTPGANPFYAGAVGLAAFSPATITLTRTDGGPFSLLSIDLARAFAFDPAPSILLTGTRANGTTVSQFLTVTAASPPLAFQRFALTGFTGLTAVRWDQPVFTQGVHQFGNVRLATTVPEPATLLLVAAGVPLVAAGWRRTRRGRRG